MACSVSDCTTTRRYNPNQYTFHRFPSHPALCEKWLRTINRPDWSPFKNSAICSKHFDDKCFIQRKQRRVLMKNTIPTLSVPIQLPRKREVSSYVNRDIILPPAVVTPSPRITKLIEINTRLKRKISEKNRIIHNLRVKSTRMSKQLLTLQELVKELNNRLEIENHRNEVTRHNNLVVFQSSFRPDGAEEFFRWS